MNTKFLVLQIDNYINLKNHIEQMIPKLSGVCYAVKSMVHISNINTFKSVCYAYLHSIIKCGVIFWGNSLIQYGVLFLGDSSNSGKIFTLQKKTSESWLVHNPELL